MPRTFVRMQNSPPERGYSANLARCSITNWFVVDDAGGSLVLRLEEVQISSMDIHPVEQAARGVPNGTFAKVGACVQQQFRVHMLFITGSSHSLRIKWRCNKRFMNIPDGD